MINVPDPDRWVVSADYGEPSDKLWRVRIAVRFGDKVHHLVRYYHNAKELVLALAKCDGDDGREVVEVREYAARA